MLNWRWGKRPEVFKVDPEYSEEAGARSSTVKYMQPFKSTNRAMSRIFRLSIHPDSALTKKLLSSTPMEIQTCDQKWGGGFDGGTISSDGGAFLLRRTDKRLNLLKRLAECFLDGRNQALVEHSIPEMLSQRVYGVALGYEDLNDHEQLRTDPIFGILAGKEDLTEPLAGKSTLNRMELGTGINDRYKKITFWKEAVDELLVNVFIESHEKAPAEIVLDMDTTDMPLHGKQEGRFFHGYYVPRGCRSLVS